MRTFIVISKKCIDTHIEFYFNDDDNICGFKIIGPSWSNTIEFAINAISLKIKLPDFISSKGATYNITEKLEELTFDKFWNRYNNKTRSSKKTTQTHWNRMSKAEQLKAYNFIQKYELSIPAGCEKKYAETYLNAELWNN